MYTRNKRRAGIPETPVALWLPTERLGKKPRVTTTEVSAPADVAKMSVVAFPATATRAKALPKAAQKPRQLPIPKPPNFPAMAALKVAFPEAVAYVEALLDALPSSQKILDLEDEITEETARYTDARRLDISLLDEEKALMIEHNLVEENQACIRRRAEQEWATGQVRWEHHEIACIERELAKRAKQVAANEKYANRASRVCKGKRKEESFEPAAKRVCL
jgi:hypothetical protein